METADRIRPALGLMAPYSPGLSIEEIKGRYGLAQVIKLASNENPLGVSPVVQKIISGYAAMAFRYPRPGSPDLRRAIAREFEIPEERIVVGNGSDEIIDLIVRALAVPGRDHVLSYSSNFSMYSQVCQVCGVEYRQVPRRADFTQPLEELVQACDENTAVVFVTSPDNPTGLASQGEEIAILRGMLPPSTLLVVDEAYIDFAWPIEQYTMLQYKEQLSNIVVVRTFSKAYGLAGLRVGFGIMDDWLADVLLKAKSPFSVNILAEKAGVAALQDQEFYLATLDLVLKERERMSKALIKLGCEVTPSQANFIMFRPPAPAEDVFAKLLAKGVIVRLLASFHLPDHLRVSIGRQDENKLFLKTLEDILNG
ncbi:MAG: histidinol-phosphate transaminase [Desulfovibrionaceae bacterium]